MSAEDGAADECDSDAAPEGEGTLIHEGEKEEHEYSDLEPAKCDECGIRAVLECDDCGVPVCFDCQLIHCCCD